MIDKSAGVFGNLSPAFFKNDKIQQLFNGLELNYGGSKKNLSC